MKRKILILIFIFFSFYLPSYFWFRQTNTEIWEKDGKSYLIFPENKMFYYIFRPLSYVDRQTTGLEFHIGQHR